MVAIYSANLLEYDWTERTQVVWVSSLLPLRTGPKIESNFEKDLKSYLEGYELAPIQKIIESFENYDFSDVKVRLVSSVPGRHKNQDKFKFGHFRVRSLLRTEAKNCQKSDKIVGQFSSIGMESPIFYF